jgi:hypothetical protein
MGRKGFIAYDPELAKDIFGSDPIVAIYYEKLLRYEQILPRDREGFFTRTIKQIEEATCIKRTKQERVRKWLEEHRFIVAMVKTRPGTAISQLHFKVVDKNRPK